MAKTPDVETTIPEKIYNLYVELLQSEKDKKDTVKAHSENIKRIKDEIKDILNGAEEEVIADQQEA